MATKLGVAPNYFTSFVDGQGVGGGPSNYFVYATDLDTNFAAIKASFNDLVDEINAINGTNFLVSFDLANFSDTDNGLFGFQAQGVLGGHSYEVSIDGGDTTQLLVQRGQGIAQSQRVKFDAVVTLPGSGGAGDRFVAIDALGTPSLETAIGSQVLDIAKVNWNGTFFDGAVTQLAHIFWDGDEYTRMRYRPDDSGIWDTGGTPALADHKAFRVFADRVQALERLITGRTTEVDGTTLPQMSFGGTPALPGIIPTDSATVRDTTTGFFRVTLNVVGFSASAVERVRFDASGLEIVSGKIRNLAGTAALPSYTFAGDPDTGVFSIGGTDRLGFATAGVLRAEFDAEGNLDLPTNSRAIVRRAVDQTMTTGITTNVSWDTEDTDIGGWIAVTATDLVVPTGADGTYLVVLAVEWEELGSGANIGQRLIQIETTGTGAVSLVQHESSASGSTRQVTTAVVELVATNVVRGQVFQNSGFNLDIDRARLTITKIA